MDRQLQRRRDAAADQHDAALASDPTRTSAAFKSKLRAVIAELENVARAAPDGSGDSTELARTLMWTASAYLDLAAGNEPDALARSAQLYLESEALRP